MKTHVGNLFAERGARDRVHAAIIAYECGLAGSGAARGWPGPGRAGPGRTRGGDAQRW